MQFLYNTKLSLVCGLIRHIYLYMILILVW